MHRRPLLGALVAAALAVPAAAQTTAQHHGLDPANMDTTCAPCQDFYRYANGGWLAHTQLPPDEPRYGSFTELQDRNADRLHAIVDRLAAAAPRSGPATTPDQKVGDYYASCMDTAQIEAAGTAPLKGELDRVAALRSTADLIAELAHLHQIGRGAAFGFGGSPDFKNSAMTIAAATQGGLGMPDRDYYFRTDSSSTALRAAYTAHVSRVLQLLGDPPAVADSETARIMALETALARGSLTRVERRNPEANYHKMSVAAADSLTPHLEWAAFMTGAGAPATDSINVAQPGFFQALDSLLAHTAIGDWQAYLRWHVAQAASSALPRAFVDEGFSWQRELTGAEQQEPRWKRCLQATSFALGDALGQAYVHDAFPPAARARALTLVDNLIAALDDRLHTLEWMSDSTRTAALVKLRAIRKKIGYPDKWRDYAPLMVDRGPYIGNAMRAQAFASARNTERIGKPVDRDEWSMTTPTVNASYNPTRNDITFPAGILQPPFFDPQADDAVNYGGMGAVIGHEMTHGFDDQGRRFDAAGNLRDWWTADDAAHFKDRAQRIIDQFDAYTVVDSSTHVNGRLTTGENIADLGGLKIAYAAFQRSLRGKPHPPRIDGLTAEQRFFLAWAQIWRSKSTDQSLRNLVRTDPHAPALWRVMGPLSNLPEFAAAFHCKAGDPMVRADSVRVEIW
jgi:putative endopeptidase